MRGSEMEHEEVVLKTLLTRLEAAEKREASKPKL
jgi:hypothetical protein